MSPSLNGKATDKEGALSPQERARIDASVRGLEQAPSSRQQLGKNVNWKQIQDQLGQPFDNELIPLPKRKLMARDPMFAFGLHYEKLPLATAPYKMNCPDPAIASFMDAAVRGIMPDYIQIRMQKLEFGFQGIAKRYAFEVPDAPYLDPDTGEEKQAWDAGSNIVPVILKAPVALAPEGCSPMFDDASGEFSGIEYIPPKGGAAPAGTGARAKGAGGSEGSVEIDIYHCSPPDEPVLTTNRGYVPIGELTEDDRLVTWSKPTKKIVRQKGFEFTSSSHRYSGDMMTVATESASTRVTPNHKFTVRWTEEAQDKWAVYLMKKGDWWRIGMTPLIKQGRKASGIGQRVSAEGAEAAWILDVFDSKNEALYNEKLWQHQYGVPGLTFKVHECRTRSGLGLTEEQVEDIWSQTDSEGGALRLLKEKRLDLSYPFFKPADEGKTVMRGLRGWTSHAVNMISGLMEVPVDPGEGRVADWQKIAIERNHYEGEVVSLTVPPHHHYVSNGVITQNSEWVTNEIHKTFGNMYGYPRTGYGYPFWWSYWFRWAVADRAFERKGDPAILVRHPEGTIDLGDGDVIASNEYALLIAEQLRAGAGIAMPSTPYYDFNDKPSSIREWEIEFLKGGIELDPFDKSFDYLDVMRLRSIFAPEQSLIEGGGGTSSRNVAKEMYSGLMESQAMEFQDICSAFNRYYIPHLMQVNFPEAVDKGIRCRMTPMGFDSNTTELLNQITQTIGQHNPAELGVDVREALRRNNLPMLPETKYQEGLVRAAEGNAAPPTGDPTRAENGVVPTAGVPPSTTENTPGPIGSGSATGFAYTAPTGWIDLSAEESAEFARELPDTIHYQDKTVKALTKQLRAVWKRFYKDQYEDFAAFLQTEEGALTLSNETAAYALELSAQGEDIELAVPRILEEIAKRVVEKWPVNEKKLSAVIEMSQDIIEKIADRASKIAKTDVKAAKDIKIDEIKMWVQDHVGDVIPGIMRTTRNELRDFVAKFAEDNDLQNEEKLPGQVRAHFSDFPSWKADRLARAESRDSYNAGYLLTGKAFGIPAAQAIDAQYGDTDDYCEQRDGQFFTIERALQEKEHPWGTLGWRLVPEPVNVVFTDDVPGGVEGSVAFHDEEAQTIYFSHGVRLEDRKKMLYAVGDKVLA